MGDMTVSGVVNEVADWRLGASHCCGRRVKLRGFLARRQGLPGSYGGLFAPVEGEIADGYRFITGERISTSAGARHILGEEALRALILLGPDAAYQRAAVDRAAESMARRLHDSETQQGGGHRSTGTYCCNRCSVALWRTLAVGGLPDAERRLDAGMKWLKARRDGEGGWSGMPFYYTISALIDIESDAARRELHYARLLVARRFDRMPVNVDDRYKLRRRAVCERALAFDGAGRPCTSLTRYTT